MHFERLCGGRIVPYLLALFHLSVTCHQSGHIPPPAESRAGWPLSSSFRHSPPAESLGNQVGRLTFIFLSSWGLEAHTTLRNGCRCHRHCDFFGVWSGSMALAESRPVDVCQLTIYGLNSGVFLSTLLHMPSPNQGVVRRSVQSVFTRLLRCLLLVFLFSRICAFVCQPITEVWTVFSPDGTRIDYESALSRRLHVLT